MRAWVVLTLIRTDESSESAVTIGAVVYDDGGAQPSAAKWVPPGISGSGELGGCPDCGAFEGPGANAALAMGGLEDESHAPAASSAHECH